MQTLLSTAVLWVILVIISVVSLGWGGSSVVPYPEGYRKWFQVKTMVIQQGHPLYEAFGGIHHVYANKKALQGMQIGKPYPDGAVLVFDLLAANMEGNAIIEGPRKIVGVMYKDAKKFSETGGWGFEAFKDDNKERTVKDPQTACFDCHAVQIEMDYVFSRYRK
jgi:hypothetical protein